MKCSLKIILVILLLGVMFMVNRYGRFVGLKFEKYSSRDPELNITMDYILGWNYTEHRGSYGSYVQVMFIEPEAEKGSFKANIVVTVKKSSNLSTVKSMAEDLLAKRLKLKEAKVLSNSKSRILNTEARDIQLAYKALDKLYSTDAKLIPIRERILVLKKGDKSYTLRYTNIEEEFKKFERAFYHCAKTLRLGGSLRSK